MTIFFNENKNIYAKGKTTVSEFQGVLTAPRNKSISCAPLVSLSLNMVTTIE
jgi:hypothetical protein